jgi:hypothetical protein
MREEKTNKKFPQIIRKILQRELFVVTAAARRCRLLSKPTMTKRERKIPANKKIGKQQQQNS